MKTYKKINIDITENGYIIEADNKQFVFNTYKKMKKWIKDNISGTGEVERFSDALDNEEKSEWDFNVPYTGKLYGTTQGTSPQVK